MRHCKTRDCPEDIPDTSSAEHCTKCRASFRYWSPKNKRPAQVLYRRSRLKLFSSRMSLIIDDRGIKDE
jgi:hypothetical protein